MRRNWVIFLITAICLAVSGGATGQKKIVRQVLRVDSMMLQRYRAAKIDTNYVTRPTTRFTLSARFNTAGAKLNTEGYNEGGHFRGRLKADYKSTLSAAVNYLGVTLALSLNPAKLLGRYSDYELSLVYYGKQFGGDLIYQKAKNYTGYYDQDGFGRLEFPADILEMKTVNANGYYVFNHRKFSYPAAMTQGYIQRRSAGSFMLAAAIQAQEGEYDYVKSFKMQITNIGLGGGYGYNWVPARRLLVHLSALPTFIVFNHTWMKYDGSRVKVGYHFPEVIITGRGAIVYQIGRNMFAALSGVYYFTNIGGKKHLEIESEKWRTRLTYGIRL